MKRFYNLVLAMLCLLPLMGCEIETYYDSVSVPVELSLPANFDKGNVKRMHQRFLFDRDLRSVGDMRVENAWLSIAPKVGQDDDFDLSLIEAFRVFIVDTTDGRRILFLEAPRAHLDKAEVELIAYDIGRFYDYVWNQRIEVEIEVTYNMHHTHRYTQKACEEVEDCSADFSLSMWFALDKD